MEERAVYVKLYEPDDPRFTVNEQEVWRYAGFLEEGRGMEEELRRLWERVRKEQKGAFSYKACFVWTDLAWKDKKPQLPFAADSQDLGKCLRGSEKLVMFAATVGLEIDRRIARAQRVSEAEALLLQAYGAERVECLCNVFCQEMRDEAKMRGWETTARFSPGYGDLPLEVQNDLFGILDCSRRIGVSLNRSLLMSPSKSVTALFGLKRAAQISAAETSTARTSAAQMKQGCAACAAKDCAYREEARRTKGNI